MTKAKIIEIFDSIQGEGLYVGEEQLFVRFYSCNLSCKFCDEQKKDFFTEYTAEELVKRLAMEKNKTASLTGGEPLLYADFLKDVLPALKKNNLKFYLETNAVLAGELLKIIDYIDIISMDIKLPSSTGLRPYWQEHRVFLEQAVEKEVFVKSVVTHQTTLSDIKKAISVIEGVDKNIPFILQPVSYNDIIEDVELLPLFFKAAKQELNHVKIIGQIHKVLGVR